ncbi:MAG: hypothetical protein L6R39_002687 [Caloplaca ligustica]|nr:MAG: hypothetical protein L6R39_002687 [Caloplaca ligustica]
MFEEDGTRVRELKQIIETVVYVATLFDDDGISIRFMNDWPSNPAMDGFNMSRLDRIQNEQMVEQIISKVKFVGLTPLGTELRNKVIEPLVLGPARARQLQKPVLVITITDGQPAGESASAIFDTIRYASNELSRMPQYGPGALSLQFAQVGNDQKAREFLAKLDSDPQVGQLVDCTSSQYNSSRMGASSFDSHLDLENEQMEMMQKTGVPLEPELWVRTQSRPEVRIIGLIESSVSNCFLARSIRLMTLKTSRRPDHLQATHMVRHPQDRMEPQIHMASHRTRGTMASLHNNLTAHRPLNKGTDPRTMGIKDMDNRRNKVGASNRLPRTDTANISSQATAHLRLLEGIETDGTVQTDSERSLNNVSKSLIISLARNARPLARALITSCNAYIVSVSSSVRVPIPYPSHAKWASVFESPHKPERLRPSGRSLCDAWE